MTGGLLILHKDIRLPSAWVRERRPMIPSQVLTERLCSTYPLHTQSCRHTLSFTLTACCVTHPLSNTHCCAAHTLSFTLAVVRHTPSLSHSGSSDDRQVYQGEGCFLIHTCLHDSPSHCFSHFHKYFHPADLGRHWSVAHLGLSGRRGHFQLREEALIQPEV